MECVRITNEKKRSAGVAADSRYYRRKAVKSKFGLTLDAVDQMERDQNYCCAGCLEPFAPATPHVDHCHTTGKVRGLLCNSCNKALGMVKDNVETLARLAAYLLATQT